LLFGTRCEQGSAACRDQVIAEKAAGGCWSAAKISRVSKTRTLQALQGTLELLRVESMQNNLAAKRLALG
tara:strand:+ start:16947 stop:17156 length:210 start_codon:yes stop_codon:yes gene_type:complete